MMKAWKRSSKSLMRISPDLPEAVLGGMNSRLNRKVSSDSAPVRPRKCHKDHAPLPARMTFVGSMEYRPLTRRQHLGRVSQEGRRAAAFFQLDQEIQEPLVHLGVQLEFPWTRRSGEGGL